MVTAVIETSADRGSVQMDQPTLDVMNEVRAFMFQRVYLGPEMEDPKNSAIKVIRDLVDYFAAHPDQVPETVQGRRRRRPDPRHRLRGRHDRPIRAPYPRLAVPTAAVRLSKVNKSTSQQVNQTQTPFSMISVCLLPRASCFMRSVSCVLPS
jgi:hypothetical protein